MRGSVAAMTVRASPLPSTRRGSLRAFEGHRKILQKASLLRSQGLRLTARGKYSAAAMAFRGALRLAEKLPASDPVFLASVLNDFGVLCKYRGRLIEARRMYLRAMRIAARLDGAREGREFAASICHNLGGVAYAQGRYGEGLKFAQRGIRSRKQIRPRDPVALAADQAACAAILAELGRYAEATALLARALGVFRRQLGARHYEVGAALANLGATYWKMGKAKAAEQRLRHAMVILESALGKRHPRTAAARRNLAFVRKRRSPTLTQRGPFGLAQGKWGTRKG
jgi:tetratricopeptide (TPR) repeat protein